MNIFKNIVNKIFKKDNRIKAIACYRRNISCKNCFELGKCTKTQKNKRGIKWLICRKK